MDLVKMHETNKRGLLKKKGILISKKEKLEEQLNTINSELNEIISQEQTLDKKFKALNSDMQAYEEALSKIKPQVKKKEEPIPIQEQEFIQEESNDGY